MADTVDAYDVAVIGGGPVGLAAALECARAGKTVVLLERFTLFNSSGSSGDFVRMFRVMYTERYLADLAVKAMKLWKELEAETGEQLVWWSGLLNFGDPTYGAGGPEGTLKGPLPNMEALGLPFEELNADQIMHRYGFTNLPSDYYGMFSPDCGCINVPLMTRTLYRLGRARGVQYKEYAAVSKLQYKTSEVGDDVIINYEQSYPDPDKLPTQHTLRAGKVIVACGAYTNSILKPLGFELDLQIWEMVYAYYSVSVTEGSESRKDIKQLFPSMWFQFAKDDATTGTSQLFYGFPPLPWGPPDMARIALDAAKNVISDPSERHGPGPSEDDLKIVQAFITKHCRGVTADPALMGNCLQTNVKDNNFVLDFLPDEDGGKKVAVFCAGWAMKFVPLLGAILKEMALGGQPNNPGDIEHFKVTRPDVLKGSPSLSSRANTLNVAYGGSAWPRYRSSGH